MSNQPAEDDLELGVQVTAATPGVTPVAFIALIEVCDADGERRYVRLDSNGLSDARAERILTATLGEEPTHVD